MKANIRLAREGDELAVAGLLIKLVKQHVEYDPNRFSDFVTIDGAASFYRSRFSADNARVIVAEIEDKIVGFAYLEFEELNYEGLIQNGTLLHDIFIEKNVRTAGIGKDLIKACVAAAKELGGNKMLLAAAARNEIAREFFERLGFRSTMIEMTLDL